MDEQMTICSKGIKHQVIPFSAFDLLRKFLKSLVIWNFQFVRISMSLFRFLGRFRIYEKVSCWSNIIKWWTSVFSNKNFRFISNFIEIWIYNCQPPLMIKAFRLIFLTFATRHLCWLLVQTISGQLQSLIDW